MNIKFHKANNTGGLRLSGWLILVMLASIPLGVSAATQSQLTPATVQAAAVDPPGSGAPLYDVYLYVNGVPVNCSSWCFYLENHVFDFATQTVIGYVDPENPMRITDEEDNTIGFLMESSS